MERNILQVLDTDGPLHVMEIASRIDGHPITVDQACARLHNDVYISPIGGSRYRLTEDGSEQLEDKCEPPREQPWERLFDAT